MEKTVELNVKCSHRTDAHLNGLPFSLIMSMHCCRERRALSCFRKFATMAQYGILTITRARFLKGRLAVIHNQNFVPFLYFTFLCIAQTNMLCYHYCIS